MADEPHGRAVSAGEPPCEPPEEVGATDARGAVEEDQGGPRPPCGVDEPSQRTVVEVRMLRHQWDVRIMMYKNNIKLIYLML